MVPNGKLIGKQLGDSYPREDMLLEEHTNGPGGRLSGLINNSTLTQGLIGIFCTYSFQQFEQNKFGFVTVRCFSKNTHQENVKTKTTIFYQ